MKTIYEKVEAKGIRIPIEICKLADISDDVIIPFVLEKFSESVILKEAI